MLVACVATVEKGYGLNGYSKNAMTKIANFQFSFGPDLKKFIRKYASDHYFFDVTRIVSLTTE